MAMNIFNLSSCDNAFIAFALWIDITNTKQVDGSIG